MWTNHVTIGSGLHKGSKLDVILWERLDDFIFGEQHHPLYPCRFDDEVIRQNLPNSLRSPRAQSATLVVRFDLLPSILHCLWISPLIFLLHLNFFFTIHRSNHFDMSFISVHVLFVRKYMSIYVIQGLRSIIHYLVV